MEISLSGDDPTEITGIVNAVKKAYMEEVVNVDFKRRAARHAMLKKAKERYTTILKERRATLRKLAETVGSDDRQTLALRQQFAIEHMAEMRKELREVQSRKRHLAAQIKMIHPQDNDTRNAAPEITESDIERAIDQDPTVRRLLDKLAQQEEQFTSNMAHLQRVARNATSDPLKARLGHEIEATRRSLEDRRKALRPTAIRGLQERGQSDKATRGDEMEQELVVLAELERELEGEVKSVSAVNQSLTVNTLDLQEIQDEVVQLNDVAAKIGSEVEAINVELEAPPRIRLVDDATIPQIRDEKKRYLMIGMITVGSFLAGLLGIAFLELQHRKVDSADEVPIELGLTVVGALPVLPLRVHRRGPTAHRETEKDRYWRNLLLESVDATRTMLVHAARNGSHRVVMITSAVSGEGKTSLASSLATSLARSGLRTLLIDADLRSPSINQLFNLPVAPGLSELLRGEVDADGAIVATTVKDLHLLAAGKCDRQTVRILAQGCLGPILAGLKERFDFVIVDSSPILPVADASIIAQEVDAVLISIFGEVSRKAKVLAAIQRLQHLGVPILGAVVTGDTGGLYGGYYSGSQVYYPMLPESAADTSDEISRGRP